MSSMTMDPMRSLPDPDRDAQFYAGIPFKRLVAWVIDALIIGVFSLIASVATIGIGFLIFPLLVIAISFAYRTLTIASGSATWGMRIVGIELRTRMGERFDLPQAAIHTGIFLFLMASVLGWIATMACILLGRYRQGIPDLLLGSTAINRPVD